MALLKAVEENYNSFLKFNETKYARFQGLIVNATVKKIINAIPAVLCMNDKKIPGYVDGCRLYGICNYTPDQETTRFIKARFGVEFAYKGNPRFIEMLSVMGSVGTIAYNKKSDFDFWACIDNSGVSKEDLGAFARKIEDVQKWAMKEGGVEVHIFINDVNNLRRNIFAEDEDEGFGSTIGAVLKDEFFRSSIIMAGKVPFWWAVPGFVPDSEYDRLFASLPEEDHKNKFVDIGNLYRISKEDFMGAALFQLIKAIGNPFKSILKIGILEKYLFNTDKALLLSQKVKSSINRGEMNSVLDSYLLMFNEVYKYYSEVLDDKSLLKILRQNLYLKIDPQLSKYVALKERKNLPYKVMVMFSVVNEWGWSIEEIRDLDDFESWDYNRIMQFWNSIKKFMLLCYQKISRELPNLNLKSKISDSDFKLLSSKLKANFSVETDKIENFITFKDTPNEPFLYIEPEKQGVKELGWRVYKKIRIDNRIEKEIGIRQEDDLVKLLAWCSINQIYEPTFSRLFFESGYQHINKNIVVSLLDSIFNMFNSEKGHLPNRFYLQPARTRKNLIIMNFNDSKSDAVVSFYHLYMNTWGEAFLKFYTNSSDLVMIFSKVMKDGLFFKKEFDDICTFASPEPHKRQYKNVEKTFRAAYEFFLHGKDYVNQRCLTSLGESIICVTREEGEISVGSFNGVAEMLSYISLRPYRYPDIKINSEDNGSLKILEEIYLRRTAGSITLVYEDKSRFYVIYVIDENGNIFSYIKKKADNSPLECAYRFCGNTVKNLHVSNTGRSVNPDIFCHRLEVDRFGKFSFRDETRKMRELDTISTGLPDALKVEVINNQGQVYYIIRQKEINIGPVVVSAIHEKLRQLKSSGSGHLEIIDLKFRNFPAEKLEAGSTLYFLEKYKLEKMMGSTL